MDLFNNTYTKQAIQEKETIERIKKYKATILSSPDFGVKSKHGKIPSIHRYTHFCLENLRKEITKTFLDKLEMLNNIVILAHKNKL